MSHEVIFEELQSMWPRSLNVTDRRIDRQMTWRSDTMLWVASRCKNPGAKTHHCRVLISNYNQSSTLYHDIISLIATV